MTLRQFLKTLRDLGLTWSVGSPAGELRCQSDDCPIVAVYRSLYPTDDTEDLNSYWAELAEEFGMDYHLADTLVCAADNLTSANDALRRRLFAVCELDLPSA